MMDFDDDILDIEGFSLNNLPSPYPKKLIVARKNPHLLTFVLVAPRSNMEIDKNGGVFITYFQDSTKLFS